MKATRLQQDLNRLHETKDRSKALDAVKKRLTTLTKQFAALKPATPAAQQKADAAKVLLSSIDAGVLKAAKTTGGNEEQAEEDF